MLPDSVPRGRTQAPKPLAPATSSTVSTRAKAKAPVSATATADKPPTITATSGTVKPAASRQPVPEKAGPSSETVAKPKKALKKSLPTKDATESTAETATPITKDDDKDSSPPPKSTEAIHISQPQPEPPTGLPIPPPDPLQIAAQTYPWLYMSSTLNACFTDAEQTAKKELDDLEEQVTGEEAQSADETTRHDSERLIDFCDELASDPFSKEAPAIMQSFMSFSEASERVEAEALQLAMSTPSLDSEEPLGVYSAMMDNLDELQNQASEIQSAILRLTTSATLPSSLTKNEVAEGDGGAEEGETTKKQVQEADSARAQIVGVFEACLPVLRARIANLSVAQELIDSAQENFSLALRMESMGIE